MSAQHTPGQWRVRPDAGDWIATYDARGSSAYEAVLADDEVVALVVARNRDPWSEPPDTAHNARLIAAAPDLLEFAQLWISRQGDDTNYMTEMARAAIAKATSQKGGA